MRGRLVLVAVLLAASPAAAEDAATTSTAVQLTDEAADLFQGGKVAAALDRYQRADALVKRHTIGVRIARCLARLGRLTEAAERYLAVARMPLPADLDPNKLDRQREALAQAEAEHAALLSRIPAVIVRISAPAGAEVTASLDGAPIPPELYGEKRLCDPGAHHLLVRATGGDAVERDLTLAEGEVAVVPITLTLAPSPSPPSAPPPRVEPPPRGARQRTAGYVLLGGGAAGVVAGVIAGGVAIAKKNALNSDCQSQGTDQLHCNPAYVTQDQVDAYNRSRIATTMCLLTGLALGVAGGIVLGTAPKRDVTITAGPGTLWLRGAF